MSIKSKYIKLTTNFENEDFKSAARSILKYITNSLFRIELETYYTFELELTSTRNIERAKIPIEIIKIDNNCSEIKRLVDFWPDYFRFGRSGILLENDIKKYFKAADECFCAVIDSTIVGMMWVGYENNHMLNTIAKRDGLKSDEAIIHRVYVNKEHRGFGIQKFLSTYIKLYLKERNFKLVRTYTGINNIASIINNMQTYDRYKVIYHLRITAFAVEFNLFPKYPADWQLTKKSRIKQD
jgi:GNAT superfamily N-acetyltransferase